MAPDSFETPPLENHGEYVFFKKLIINNLNYKIFENSKKST